MRPTVSVVRPWVVVLITCFLSACSVGRPSQPPKGGRSDQAVTTIRVEGKITEEGIECVALRSDSGELFTLLEVPDPFNQWHRYVGVRFLVIGEETKMSHCMQGRTLRIVSMSMVNPTVR